MKKSAPDNFFKSDIKWGSPGHKHALCIMDPHLAAMMTVVQGAPGDRPSILMMYLEREDVTSPWSLKSEDGTKVWDAYGPSFTPAADTFSYVEEFVEPAISQLEAQDELVLSVGSERVEAHALAKHEAGVARVNAALRVREARQRKVEDFATKWTGSTAIVHAIEPSATPFHHSEVIYSAIGPIRLEISSGKLIEFSTLSGLPLLVSRGKEEDGIFKATWNGDWSGLPTNEPVSSMLTSLLQMTLEKHSNLIDRATHTYIANEVQVLRDLDDAIHCHHELVQDEYVRTLMEVSELRQRAAPTTSSAPGL